MLKNRWFSVLIAAALLVMVTMLIFQGLATAQVTSSSGGPAVVTSASAPATVGCAFLAEDIHAMHAVYENASGLWLARTAHGVAGVDGGALELRNCRAPGK